MSTIVVSVVSVPGSGFVYSAPAVYEALPRKDGTLTYRRAWLPMGKKPNKNGKRIPVGFRSVAKATKKAQEVAADWGVPFVAGIRHGSPVQ